MRTNRLQINQEICTKALILTIIAITATYITLVVMLTFDTAVRKDLVEAISVRQSQIAELESRALSQARNIDRELATSLGLVKSVANEAIIVVRDGTTRLTINE